MIGMGVADKYCADFSHRKAVVAKVLLQLSMANTNVYDDTCLANFQVVAIAATPTAEAV
jgi:hypothetical protein